MAVVRITSGVMQRKAGTLLARAAVCVLITLPVLGGVFGELHMMTGESSFSVFSPTRHLLSNAWTSQNPDRKCWPAFDGTCQPGDFALLSVDAPLPKSLGGRLLAKTIAQGYNCWQHATVSACDDDKANRCAWRDELGCATNSTAQLLTVREALLCPASLAEQLFQCSMNFKRPDCQAVRGCSWAEAGSMCMPATLAMKAPEELAALLPSVGRLDASVWGCCEGNRLLKTLMGCSAALEPVGCGGACRWDMQQGTCTLSQQGLLGDVLGGRDAQLVEFLEKVSAACGALPGNMGACSTSDLFVVDPVKVAQYATWVPSAEERGSCSGDLARGTVVQPESARRESANETVPGAGSSSAAAEASQPGAGAPVAALSPMSATPSTTPSSAGRLSGPHMLRLAVPALAAAVLAAGLEAWLG